MHRMSTLASLVPDTPQCKYVSFLAFARVPFATLLHIHRLILRYSAPEIDIHKLRMSSHSSCCVVCTEGTPSYQRTCCRLVLELRWDLLVTPSATVGRHHHSANSVYERQSQLMMTKSPLPSQCYPGILSVVHRRKSCEKDPH